MEIQIGPKVRGYSTTLFFEGEDMRVNIGASNSGCEELRRPVATCEGFGLRFVITDEDKVHELASAAKLQDAAAVRRRLASFVPEVLANQPEVFEKVMKERFQAGVREGRRQKARELRKVFEED